MNRVHLHSEQFDGHAHPSCGRGSTAAPRLQFEAADPAQRCKYCEREWFPLGQPEWHHRQAQEELKKEVSREHST
jgi:hypothetical protein